ncbi:MAG: site-2 protease family protein [Peptococcaceae bacterium]
MFFGDSITSMLATLLAVLVAITFHETAHGYVAYSLGDTTAKDQGRLTLNPLAHLDPIGALLMFIAGFGWAKPVPVNPFYFKGDRTRGMMLVSIAGPLTNLALSFLAYFVYVAGSGFYSIPFLSIFLRSMVTLNIYLAIFNLIPIPPLDGSKILAGFLPKATAYKYLNTVEQYGFLILMVLIIFNVTDMILVPIANAVLNLFSQILFLIF